MFCYMQKENVYKQEAEDDPKTIMVDAILLSIIVTLIGLWCSVYNYYVFDNPFMTTTTIGLLAVFSVRQWLPLVYPSQIGSKDKKKV